MRAYAITYNGNVLLVKDDPSEAFSILLNQVAKVKSLTKAKALGYEVKSHTVRKTELRKLAWRSLTSLLGDLSPEDHALSKLTNQLCKRLQDA